MEKVSFKTFDEVTIVANWFSVENSQKYIILLHMMPAVKESWNDFAFKLNQAGFSALAIDLRGHGESISKNTEKLDYNNFTDKEHQGSRLDVDASIDFLKQKGAKLENIYIAGASIGANLAIDTLVRYKEIKKGITLSAGLNYKGVQTLPLVKSMSAEQSLFLIATKDDVRSGGPANQMNQSIYNEVVCKKEIKIFDTGGHGTTILENHPEFMDELIEWLRG